MSVFHDRDNNITAPLSKSLKENIETLDILFKDFSDIVKREFKIGGENKVSVYVIYVDNMVDRSLLDEDIMRYLLYHMDELPKENKFEYIKDKGVRSADMSVVTDMNAAIQAILSGETAIFVDGYDKVIKASVKGMPNRGVPESDNEVAIRGSKEGFSEALNINRVLIRRRIKDTNLKMKKMKVGTRTQTDISIVYLEGVSKPEFLEELERRLDEYVIDGIFDSGMLEQLVERNTLSPFPEFQSTERPDKAAAALLEGRVVILVDNSPMAIILPATLNSFLQASDDAYERWEISTFTRVLRYIGAFLTMALPGLYIAVINFQPEVLSSAMALSFAAAREGVPFSVLFEVIMMEIAFQMLLEAGIRLPGPMGSTLGIVGGLIIGDAAVNANLVSPIVVIVIAFTAIAAFTVPNPSFAYAFRIFRFLVLFLSAFFGLFGFIIGLMFILIHLAGLKSFGIPYLLPFSSTGLNEGEEMKDSIIKFPLRSLTRRPIYSKMSERIRLVEKNKKK